MGSRCSVCHHRILFSKLKLVNVYVSPNKDDHDFTVSGIMGRVCQTCMYRGNGKTNLTLDKNGFCVW